MKIKHLLLAFAITILATHSVLSQKKSVPNVVSIKLQNMGPILSESEVTGYYMFYQTDALSKKVYSYEIEILDQNLNKLSSKTIQGSKYLSLVDAVYNNSSLMLKLYDSKDKEITFAQYDNNAKEIMKTSRGANDYEVMVLASMGDKQGQNVTIFPLNKIGFVDYRSEKDKKYKYIIDFYPTTKGGKKWSVSSDESSEVHEFATFIYGDANVLISSVVSKPSIMSKKTETSLVAVDIKTGKKLYEKSISHPEYELLVLNGLDSDSEGNVYLFGNYFPKGKSELSSPSEGLFALKLDKSGTTKEINLISWEKDVSKFVDVNEKGKMKDVGYVFFHDFIRNADGNVYAIGEQYKKKMSGVTTDMLVQDLMIFELNSDYKLQKVKIIEKQKSKVSVSGLGMAGSQILAYYVKSLGGFDYEFVEFNKDHSIFSIGYINFVKVKGEPNKYVYGSITYTDSEAVEDKVDLMTVKDEKQIKVLPAKIGNIVIVEYLEKEKQLNMRIEKINY
jgi:hypothetical protein